MEFMRGFRIVIEPENANSGNLRHFSGYNVNQEGALYKECPCCKNQMFPALNLNFKDPLLLSLRIWPQRYLNILFCPFCGFYMKPYWIRYTKSEVDIIGGDCTSPEIFQEIETPYTVRSAALKELRVDENPSDLSIRSEYINRQREEGVYHQVGGQPIYGEKVQLKCPDCDDLMPFAGILDYDDLDIPLYEKGHKPVALIIGDKNCMNWYTCFHCLIVGLKWIY